VEKSLVFTGHMLYSLNLLPVEGAYGIASCYSTFVLNFHGTLFFSDGASILSCLLRSPFTIGIGTVDQFEVPRFHRGNNYICIIIIKFDIRYKCMQAFMHAIT